MFRKYQKSSLYIYKYYISASHCLAFLHPSLPISILISPPLLFLLSCVPTSPPALCLCSCLSRSVPVWLRFGLVARGGIWLAPTGMFLCGCCWASRQTKVCVCVFDVFSDPVTRSTYDSLPGHSIPRGHGHTDTDRNRNAHQLHLPLTFLLIEFLICFFCSAFINTGYTYFLSSYVTFSFILFCLSADELLWLSSHNLTFSVAVCLFFPISTCLSETLTALFLVSLPSVSSYRDKPLTCLYVPEATLTILSVSPSASPATLR